MPKNQDPQTWARRAARRIALISVLSFAATAAPLAVAPAAEAATTRGGCTLGPLSPIYVKHGPDGRKVIDYRISLDCQADRRLEVQQQFWEADSGCGIFTCNYDDPQGSTTHSRTFKETGGQFRLHAERSLPNTEDGAEDVYHQIRFRTLSRDGQWTSGWSSWERSRTVSFDN